MEIDPVYGVDVFSSGLLRPGKIFSYAELPAPTKVRTGTIAHTLEHGRLVNDGAGWQGTRSEALTKSNTLMFKHINFALAGMSGGTTFQEVFELPAWGRVQVRALYAGTSSVQGFTVVDVAAASGSAYADLNPLNPDATAATWTVDSSGVVVGLADASASTNGIYAFNYSPWITVDLQARTDGVSNSSVLFMRSRFTSTNSTPVGMVGNASRPINQYQNQAIFRSRSDYQSGNFTSANQANFAPGANTNSYFRPIYALEVRGLQGVLTIAATGDSTTQGLVISDTTDSGCYDWLDRAVEIASTLRGKRISSFNLALEGKDTTWFYGHATTYLNTSGVTLPQVMVIQPFSRNNSGGYTDANVRAAFTDAITLANLCIAKGVAPMLRTLLPAAGTNLAGEAARVWVNTEVRRGGIPFIDLDAALTNGVQPIASIPSAWTSDGVHLSTEGNRLAGIRAYQDLARYGLV